MSTFASVPSRGFKRNMHLPAALFPEKAKIQRWWRSGKRNDREMMRKTKSLKHTDCSAGARLDGADQAASQQLTMCLSLVGVKFSVEGGWNKVSFWLISIWLASVSCINLGKQLLANVNRCTPTAWKPLLYPPAITVVYLYLGPIFHCGRVSKAFGDFDPCLDRKGVWLVQRLISLIFFLFLDMGSFYVLFFFNNENKQQKTLIILTDSSDSSTIADPGGQV